MWGNSQYGDCVSAEEAAAKAQFSLMNGGTTELFVAEKDVIAWASAHGFLNGAMLTDVMDVMAKTGLPANGKLWDDGPYQSVDWTNDAVLSSAIYQGPVKIGVAAGQLENVVTNTNGWIATGFRRDENIDHCVNLCGYGTLAQLATALKVTLPGNVDPTVRGYLLFTWDTIGIIDQASMVAITGEAWLRTPTTTESPNPPTPPTPPHPHPTRRAIAVAHRFAELYVRHPAAILNIIEELENRAAGFESQP
jgi:hypothetical protein